MTPEEFKRTRESLGLTAADLARILGGMPLSTIYRWEDANRPPGDRDTARRIACQVLAWMVAGFRPPQWPKG